MAHVSDLIASDINAYLKKHQHKTRTFSLCRQGALCGRSPRHGPAPIHHPRKRR